MAAAFKPHICFHSEDGPVSFDNPTASAIAEVAFAPNSRTGKVSIPSIPLPSLRLSAIKKRGTVIAERFSMSISLSFELTDFVVIFSQEATVEDNEVHLTTKNYVMKVTPNPDGPFVRLTPS